MVYCCFRYYGEAITSVVSPVHRQEEPSVHVYTQRHCKGYCLVIHCGHEANYFCLFTRLTHKYRNQLPFIK